MTHLLLTNAEFLGLPVSRCRKGTSLKLPIPEGFPIVRGVPPKYIRLGGKLYEFKGMGMSAYFYHETDVTVYDID